MFEKKPTNRPSYARIEYRAVKSLVEQKLAEGYSIKLIYEELVGSGCVTMGYTSFCDYIRGQGERRHGPQKNAQKQSQVQNKTSAAPAPSRKIGPADKAEPFRVERRSLEELI